MSSSVMNQHVVDEFDYKSATVEQIEASLKRTGGCVVRNLISTSEADTLAETVKPFLEGDEPWEGDFFPKETRRVMGLAGKSPMYMEKITGNKLYQDLCSRVLRTQTTIWVGDRQETNVSEPQVNSTAVICVQPGASGQPLHRDDMLHHNVNPEVSVDQFTFNRETAVGLFVAGTKTTKANGATRFIPGSHLDDTFHGPPDERQTVYAELDKGDAFFMLASCYHGGSANTTTDQMRTIYGTFMTRGTLRQEENQFLANPIEKVKNLPIHLQKALGYTVSEPFLGWVDLKDPIRFVQGGKAAAA